MTSFQRTGCFFFFLVLIFQLYFEQLILPNGLTLYGAISVCYFQMLLNMNFQFLNLKMEIYVN